MMSALRAGIIASTVMLFPLAALAEPLDFPKLKTMVENMGFTATVISKGDDNPKFEASVTTGSFNVPIGFEVSKSTRYIWASASLGPSKLDGAGALAMLKKAGDIQPTTFWITSKGTLMIGMAIDNRDVTPAHMKFVMDKLAGDVSSTAALWQGGQ